ncbi:MAG: Trm112 family protein [Armatimonadetes bacterium]|nr:Trm112 family protein [Armatimonadota bacterium]
MALPVWVLKILACPKETCRSALAVDLQQPALVCTGCGAFYPIRDGIPCFVDIEMEKESDTESESDP